MIVRYGWLLAAALAVSSCGDEPGALPTTRPDWTGAAIGGIAPLMSPREVAVALQRRGYRQVPCAPTERLMVDPLNRGGGMPCYESPATAMRISLYFLELHEGRRLAVANFRHRGNMSDPAARSVANRFYAQRLRRRFGPPAHVTKNPSFSIVYWYRPGGQPSLPDVISTTIDAYSEPNVSLTSMWAYAQVRGR
ncbi:hypothetical protein [Sphingomonas endolithica]|uniref:hypothetical protein n=1 Tax=Sphingomonas endolithica TaxID=2972485 RepID=UPI0021AEE5B9|nr:hypothetical protein [Sphingomonas sp. ZFBP2030]